MWRSGVAGRPNVAERITGLLQRSALPQLTNFLRVSHLDLTSKRMNSIGDKGRPRFGSPERPDRRASAGANLEDRRDTGRIPATFGVSEADGSGVHLCQAEDIAIGGITIKHARGLSHEPRTEVALRFALPGSNQEIEARGEIVSDASAGRFRRTGVRFIAVRPEHQQLIAAYCRRR